MRQGALPHRERYAGLVQGGETTIHDIIPSLQIFLPHRVRHLCSPIAPRASTIVVLALPRPPLSRGWLTCFPMRGTLVTAIFILSCLSSALMITITITTTTLGSCWCPFFRLSSCFFVSLILLCVWAGCHAMPPPTAARYDVRQVIPVQHGSALDGVPRIAAVFQNDCLYLAHHMITLGHEYRHGLPPPANQTATMIDTVPLFRELAARRWGLTN